MITNYISTLLYMFRLLAILGQYKITVTLTSTQQSHSMA